VNARFERALRAIFTERRITLYPLLTFGVLVCVAAYDRLFGNGLENAFGGGVGGDFLAFYTGGHFVAHGAAAQLYDADAQLAFQQRVVGAELESVARWVSPPYVAWLFAPLGLMPYLWALATWTAVSLAGVWLSFRALGRDLGLSQSPSRLLFIALQYYPALQWVLNGQATGLWLVLLVNSFVLLRRSKDVAAGLLLGCFALKPPLALGVAIALLAAGRFRALAAAALSAGALVALGFVTLPQAMVEYVRRGPELVNLVRSDGYATAGLHGSFELATLLLDGISPPLAVLVGTLLMLAVLAWIFVSWRRAAWAPATLAWDLRMASTLTAGVIASPHLFIYDLTLLLLPLCVLLARSSPGHPPLDGWPRLPLVALVWALGLVGPALTLLQQVVSRRLLGFPLAIQLGAVVILATAVVLAREADSSGSGSLTDR
jgi:alpha-1,2-mannosyltransferase